MNIKISPLIENFIYNISNEIKKQNIRQDIISNILKPLIDDTLSNYNLYFYVIIIFITLTILLQLLLLFIVIRINSKMMPLVISRIN